MSDEKEKSNDQEPNKVLVGLLIAIWIVSLITMWIIYGVFAPNLVLFIIALVITVGGPALYYGRVWYKTSKRR